MRAARRTRQALAGGWPRDRGPARARGGGAGGRDGFGVDFGGRDGFGVDFGGRDGFGIDCADDAGGPRVDLAR